MEQKKRYRMTVAVMMLVLFCLFSACSKKETAKYWCDRGIALSDAGKHLDAISAFTRAIQADPAYGPAYENRGISHSMLGNYYQAQDDFNIVLSLNDKRVPVQDIYRDIGLAYFRMGKVQDAISEWKKGLAVANDVTLLNNLSVAYLRLNQIDKAAEAASSAYKLDPSLPQVLNSMAEIAMLQHDYPRAIDFFERAIQHGPDNPWRYWNAALACQKNKQNDKALQYARKFVEKEKDPGQLQRGYTLIEELRKKGAK